MTRRAGGTHKKSLRLESIHQVFGIAVELGDIVFHLTGKFRSLNKSLQFPLHGGSSSRVQGLCSQHGIKLIGAFYSCSRTWIILDCGWKRSSGQELKLIYKFDLASKGGIEHKIKKKKIDSVAVDWIRFSTPSLSMNQLITHLLISEVDFWKTRMIFSNDLFNRIPYYWWDNLFLKVKIP